MVREEVKRAVVCYVDGFIFFIFYFFVNPIYRAKITIYVTRTIGSVGLRTGQVAHCYCPKSCWDSGSCNPDCVDVGRIRGVTDMYSRYDVARYFRLLSSISSVFISPIC